MGGGKGRKAEWIVTFAEASQITLYVAIFGMLTIPFSLISLISPPPPHGTRVKCHPLGFHKPIQALALLNNDYRNTVVFILTYLVDRQSQEA